MAAHLQTARVKVSQVIQFKAPTERKTSDADIARDESRTGQLVAMRHVHLPTVLATMRLVSKIKAAEIEGGETPDSAA